MSWNEILRRHAAALLRDLAAELGEPAAEPDESFPVAYVIEPPWESPHLYEHATCRNCGRALVCSPDGAAWRRVWVHADEPDFGFPPGLPGGQLPGRRVG